MRIESEFTFAAPREAVYQALQDPQILAGALPGTEVLDRVGDDRYTGAMVVSVGPVTAARFDVSVELRDKVAPERFDMHVDGKGAAGFVKGVAHVELQDAGTGTVMSYRADLQVGGRVAGVGQRLLDSVGKAMSRRGLEEVNRALIEKVGPVGEPPTGADGTALATAASSGLPARRGVDRRLLLVLAIVAAILLVWIL